MLLPIALALLIAPTIPDSSKQSPRPISPSGQYTDKAHTFPGESLWREIFFQEAADLYLLPPAQSLHSQFLMTTSFPFVLVSFLLP